MEAQFAAIVADAAKQYADSSGNSLDSFDKPQMKTVDDLMNQINTHNEQFDHFRAKRHNVFKAMGIALKPVELIGEMASGPAAEAFPPTQNIFAAVLYLVGAAHNVSSMYDTIEELFDQIKVRYTVHVH